MTSESDRDEKETGMISHVEGVLARDPEGRMKVATDGPDGVVAVPAGMHPMAARGMGHGWHELEAAATRGARVVLSIVEGPTPLVIEIDEIVPADAASIATARERVAPALA
jgi:hypothetical protein